MTLYSFGRSRICCRNASAIESLMMMSRPVFGFLNLHPWAAVDQLGAEFLLRQRVRPVAEAAFGELHDVALVDDRHRRLVVVDGVLDRLAHQALGAFDRDRLDAQARRFREADLGDAHFLDQEVHQLLDAFGALLVFDAGVDVFRVLAEDDHVGLLRLFQRRRHAGEVAHRAQADVQVELLAQGDVERTDAAADRGRQRTLDRDDVVFHRARGFLPAARRPGRTRWSTFRRRTLPSS